MIVVEFISWLWAAALRHWQFTISTIVVGLPGVYYGRKAVVWMERQFNAPANNQIVVAPSLDALEHSRRAYTASHPPRLVVKGVHYVADDDWPLIRFTLLNEGQSRAIIGESAVTAWIPVRNAEWPAVPPYKGDPVTNLSELAGSRDLQLSYKDSDDSFGLLSGDVASDELETVLLGHVRYTDDNGTSHRIGFCRRRIERSTLFAAVDKPDYEYSY